MKRDLRCLRCGYKFSMDIPECPIKYYSCFDNPFLDKIGNTELYRADIDIRGMNCPKCGNMGSVEVIAIPFKEKPIIVSSKSNFYLSILYPWEIKNSRVTFKNGYQYYVSRGMLVKDYKKLVAIEDQKNIDKFIYEYPDHKKKIFNKEDTLKKYISLRCENDEGFRNVLANMSGKRIEFINNNTYIGMKHHGGNKVGKNTYGKLLMKTALRLGSEIEL